MAVVPASAFPADAPPPPAPASSPALPEEAQNELDAIRAAAKVCAANEKAPECEGGRALAREYPLMHCGPSGVDPAYTFAWASAEPLPGATAFKDEDGRTWYVEPARSPKLARVDERIWSEADWQTVEPNLRFVTAYPTEAEAKRLAILDEQITKKTRAEGIVRAVFYGNEFVGAYPFYAALKPSVDGGMLYGFYIYKKAHPLCKTPEPRVLSDDLAEFAGTWARLR